MSQTGDGINITTELISQMQKNPTIVAKSVAELPDPKLLWNNHYPRKKFLIELTYMMISLCMWSLLVVRNLSDRPHPLLPVVSFLSAMLFVDWISGMLHWACDTWGAFSTPIFGPTLIRSFRMHHVDPQDITKHGFVETNASSCYPMPPFIGLALYWGSENVLAALYCWTIMFGVVLGLYTNEIHKWAHMVSAKPHRVVQLLQSAGLIIDHAKHHVHHIDDFDRNYCIINGWMNPFLEKINYWRLLEKIITHLTGAIPRADDVFWREVKKHKYI